MPPDSEQEDPELRADRERRALVMGVHPDRLIPHDGPEICVVCGVSTGEEHVLSTHDANSDLVGGCDGES